MPAKAVWIVVGDVHENLTRLPDIPELAEASGVVVNGDFTNYGGPGKLAGIYGALAERCPRVLGHVGNLDRPECQDWLETRGVNIHARAVELAPGVCAMGLGGSTLEDAYRVLGLTSSATDDEVRRAYKRMALENHPDRVASLGDDIRRAAEKKFKEINEAKDRIYKARGMK